MENKKRLLPLDDSQLDAVNGGVNDGAPVRTVHLAELTTDQLSYYLMGLCPYCHNPLKSEGGIYGCSGPTCRVIFVE